MTAATQVTKKCKLCTVSFVPEGSQINCPTCGRKSGDAHKTANQLKKALKLAQTMAKHGTSAPEAAAAGQGTWAMAAELAGVTEPSEVSQALTIVLLAGASE